MAFDLDPNYKQVPERIADFKALYPTGSLRCLDPAKPYSIEVIDGQAFVVYAAAAYRTPDDPAPGVGIAWEPVPGKTPYTRLSELQNAETSAWGRAIVAVLASESKAVASAEDVRNRQADHSAPPSNEPTLLAGWSSLEEQDEAHQDLKSEISEQSPEVQASMREFRKDCRFGWPMTKAGLEQMRAQLALLSAPKIEGSGTADERLSDEQDVPSPAPSSDLAERAAQMAGKAALPPDRKLEGAKG